MKKTKLELDVELYAAWSVNEDAFLASTAGRYRSKVRGPRGDELLIGIGGEDLKKVIEQSFFAGAAHLACRPEEVEVLEIVNQDNAVVWQDYGWKSAFRFRPNPVVDLAKRATLQNAVAGGVGLLMLKSLVKNEARAGTTPTALSGTASGFMPPPQFWYKNSAISGLSNGTAITTWPNAGSRGSAFDLVQGGNGSPPTKQIDSGFACAYFNGGHGLIYPSSNAVEIFPANGFKNWTIFVVYRDSNGSGYFGFLSRWHADGTVSTLGMNPTQVGANGFSQIHDNDGFPLNLSMASDDAMNLTSMRWGQPSTSDGQITHWRGRTASPTTASWSPYSYALTVKGLGASRSSWNTGYLYEMILYDSALSDSQVAEVRAYLASVFPGSPVAA